MAGVARSSTYMSGADAALTGLPACTAGGSASAGIPGGAAPAPDQDREPPALGLGGMGMTYPAPSLRAGPFEVAHMHPRLGPPAPRVEGPEDIGH